MSFLSVLRLKRDELFVLISHACILQLGIEYKGKSQFYVRFH